LGAFGKLHKLPVVMEKGMSKAKRAVFPSGSFNHSVEMAVKDFIKLEEAAVGVFGIKKKIKLPPKKKADNKKRAVKKQVKKKK